MERLTKRDIDGCLIHPWSFNGINGSYDIWDEELLAKQIDRLAAYEELMERWKLRSIEEADRIFQRVNALGGTDLMAQYRAIGSIDHLRDLIKAEQDGRLVVLPCKVGDTIYYTREGRPIVEPLKVRTFLTREEAEAALAQKGGDD